MNRSLVIQKQTYPAVTKSFLEFTSRTRKLFIFAMAELRVIEQIVTCD